MKIIYMDGKPRGVVRVEPARYGFESVFLDQPGFEGRPCTCHSLPAGYVSGGRGKVRASGHMFSFDNRGEE